MGGWDGITASKVPHPCVPQGLGGWELSVRKDINTKADEDYSSRVQNPDPFDPSQTTFVFVTPRRWSAKQNWAAERRAEGKWRAVVALDADDLETWLEATPAVHFWFSITIGKHPDEAVDLDTFWADWSAVTHPPATAEFILAGRQTAVEQIQSAIKEANETFAIKAESPEEALAVVAAAVYQLADEERELYLSKTVVVRTRTALDHLAASDASLILIPLFDDAAAISRAVRRKHRVVMPVGKEHEDTETTVTVGRLSTEDAEKALVKSGIGTEDARELAVLGRRSLMALRRKLALRPEAQQPSWARPEQARSVVPFLLAGSWNEGVDGDLTVLGALARTSSEQAQENASRWSRESDPPVRSVGNVWYVTSKEDAWRLLAPALNRFDLERFEHAVLTVLGTADPRFDIPVEDRWMSLERPQHSSTLRQGLAETLAVMGALGTTVQVASVPVAASAARIGRKLLERGNADWRIWASLSHQLPLLAEAAPEEFLTAVEQGLTGGRPILQMFQEQSDTLFSSSAHTGLLWALERLAWSAEHLPRTALALAKLTRLDPGGTLGNRPRRSLRETFLIWHPQTSAPWDRQLVTLRMLLEREPEIGWQLHSDLLPKFYDSCTSRSKPEWRDWAPPAPLSMTVGEHARRVRDLVGQMLAAVGHDGQRWADLVTALPNVPTDIHDAVVHGLEQLDVQAMPPAGRAAVWNALRDVVAHHRSFPDANWALPKERVDELESLYHRFEPVDAVARFGWLFADNVRLPEGREDDWEAEEQSVAEARGDAISAIFQQQGTAGIESLIPHVETPSLLGEAFGASSLADDDEDDLLGRHLAADDPKSREFARGFVLGHRNSRGVAWREEKFRLKGLSATQRAEILTLLPTEPHTWELARSDAAVEETYWKQVQAYFRGSTAEVEYAVRKLIEHGRAYSAAKLLAFHLRDVPPPTAVLVAETLEAALRQPHVDDRSNSFAYHAGKLLDALACSATVDETRIAGIEWGFAPLLSHDRPPVILHRELARNPEFFAELISVIFRPEGGQPREFSADDQNRAGAAYDVLNSWKSTPGQSVTGSLDEAALAAWVRSALAITAERGRPTVGAQYVGQILSHSPHGFDGAWPHEAVREVIEHNENPEIETGFEIGTFNQRGVVTRSLDEGGRQEHALADQYARWSTQVGSQWPRTAAVLRRLEAKYRREAGREDADTDLRRDGMW